MVQVAHLHTVSQVGHQARPQDAVIRARAMRHAHQLGYMSSYRTWVELIPVSHTYSRAREVCQRRDIQEI